MPFLYRPSKSSYILAVILLTPFLTGCGGGGGSNDDPGNSGAESLSLTDTTTLLPFAGRMDWSADGEWIAYDKPELVADLFWDLYRIRPDSTGNECLTCDHVSLGLPSGEKGNPAYHPGGRYLLFQAELASHPVSSETGLGKGVFHNLWVLDFDTSQFHRLTDIAPTIVNPDPEQRSLGSLHAHFSHDGTKLLWGDLTRSSPCYGDWKIAIADFVSEPVPHLENQVSFEPGEQKRFYEAQDWSVDDTGVYFTCAPLNGQDDRTLDLCHFDLNSQVLTRLTQSAGQDGEARVWDEHAKLSPQGDLIVWMSSAGSTIPEAAGICNDVQFLKTDLWVMDTDGSKQRRLTHFNDPDHADFVSEGVLISDLSWSADGSQLAAKVFFRNLKTERLEIFHFTRQ